MSAELMDLIERLICSGTVTQYGEVKERLYDPVPHSFEGLDDECFFCEAWPCRLRMEHDATCSWVEAMRLLGHELPEGHTVSDSPPSSSRGTA